MNANFGLLDELETPVRDKQVKRERYAERALRELGVWMAEHSVAPAYEHV